MKISKTWNYYLNQFDINQKDIYFSEEYIHLYQSNDIEVETFIYEEDKNVFLFTYLKKPIYYKDKCFFDFETPYGYGGPIANTNSPDFIRNAINCFIKTALKNKIICGFVRFHPLIKNYQLFNESFKNRLILIQDRKTIAMDLSLTNDDIWNKEIHSKHRNVIRKAITSGLEYEVDTEFKYMDEFKTIYHQTMLDLNAENFYLFNDHYFDQIKKTLKKNSFLGLVKKGQKIISIGLFFHYNHWGHYHLAGSLKDYLNFYPNNFLLYQTALYLKTQNIQWFHLGGGTNSDSENSLYKFKKRFSKNEFDFYIGKFLINPEIYNEIVIEWETKFPDKNVKYKNFFLKYRY